VLCPILPHHFGQIADPRGLRAREVAQIVNADVLAADGRQRGREIVAKHLVIEMTTTDSRQQLRARVFRHIRVEMVLQLGPDVRRDVHGARCGPARLRDAVCVRNPRRRDPVMDAAANPMAGDSARHCVEALRIGLASSDEIRNWSHGEVTKPETVDLNALRDRKFVPLPGGLYCTQVFGPT
jgi:hypothetical protein